MPFVPGTFTDQQTIDLRRFCGYPVYGAGQVVNPAPWMIRFYMAFEWKLQNMSASEVSTVVSVYLTNLSSLENAIPATSQNLDTDQAAVWKHNKNELADRVKLMDYWRTRLCAFIGVEKGPYFDAGGSNSGSVSLVA